MAVRDGEELVDCVEETLIVFVDERVCVRVGVVVTVIVLEGVGPGLAGSISIRTTIPLPIIEKSVVQVINIFSCVA